MTKWEMASYLTREFYGLSGPNVTQIWNKKDSKTGLTNWDEIAKYGQDGWELVSVTPLAIGGSTTQLLYSFKRPVASG